MAGASDALPELTRRGAGAKGLTPMARESCAHARSLLAVAPGFSRLLYFCGSAGRFWCVSTNLTAAPYRCLDDFSGSVRVLNSAAEGWRQALRVVAFQAVATLLAAAACLVLGPRAALAALVGGGAMALGSLLAAWGAFGGGVAGAGTALGRLLLGTALKWVVVAGGLYLAMAVWRLPAVPALAGAAFAAAAFVVSMKFAATRPSTTRAST